jgi:hypothetical protein
MGGAAPKLPIPPPPPDTIITVWAIRLANVNVSNRFVRFSARFLKTFERWKRMSIIYA